MQRAPPRILCPPCSRIHRNMLHATRLCVLYGGQQRERVVSRARTRNRRRVGHGSRGLQSAPCRAGQRRGKLGGIASRDICRLDHALESASAPHPGGNPGANLKSISHRCYLFEVAFVWELTKETIVLPLGCLQGGSAYGTGAAASGVHLRAGPVVEEAPIWQRSLHAATYAIPLEERLLLTIIEKCEGPLRARPHRPSCRC